MPQPPDRNGDDPPSLREWRSALVRFNRQTKGPTGPLAPLIELVSRYAKTMESRLELQIRTLRDDDPDLATHFQSATEESRQLQVQLSRILSHRSSPAPGEISPAQ